MNDFIHRKESRRMDKFTQYAMIASDEAIADANLDLDHIINFELVLFGEQELADWKLFKKKF